MSTNGHFSVTFAPLRIRLFVCFFSGLDIANIILMNSQMMSLRLNVCAALYDRKCIWFCLVSVWLKTKKYSLLKTVEIVYTAQWLGILVVPDFYDKIQIILHNYRDRQPLKEWLRVLLEKWLETWQKPTKANCSMFTNVHGGQISFPLWLLRWIKKVTKNSSLLLY